MANWDNQLGRSSDSRDGWDVMLQPLDACTILSHPASRILAPSPPRGQKKKKIPKRRQSIIERTETGVGLPAVEGYLLMRHTHGLSLVSEV